MENMYEAFVSFKKNVRITDICCWYPYSAADKNLLIEDKPVCSLEKYGIDTPIWSNRKSLSGNIEESNNELFASDVELIVPTFAPGPEYIDGTPELVMRCYANPRVFAFRIFPKTFKHSCETWLMGGYYKWMEEHRLPLIIQHSEIAFDNLAKLLEANPSLDIILDGADTKTMYNSRDIYALFKHYTNLYLELHNFTQFGFLERIIDNFGTDRLLYGSNYPYSDPNIPLYMIFKSGIGKKEQDAILHNNAERLKNKRRPSAGLH